MPVVVTRRAIMLVPVCLLFSIVGLSAQIVPQGGPEPSALDASGRKVGIRYRHHEVPNDPSASADILARRTVSPGAIVTRGAFTSVQVNVDANGNNIVGDAANEPSIAIDPTDPNKIVIGWRQFDTVELDFRQAGWAYSHDAGKTWTFAGVLEPGVFRSDPVLDADADGNFYFYSLTSDFTCDLFKSTDGGVSWGPPVPAFGGDKPWMAIDRTGGIGNGNIYAAWGSSGGFLTRSIDGGATLEEPIANSWVGYGTLSVGPEGELYTVDAGFRVAKSIDAQDPSLTSTFEVVEFSALDGFWVPSSESPNPGGLAGQAWVATDHSDSTTRGNVYVLGSILDYLWYSNAIDVLFARSSDGGDTWSEPVRLNDDPINDDQFGAETWQWFGTMSVAPNGRIDVIWNDTRNTGQPNLSELYYTFSVDAGNTWSANVPLSPVWDSWVGIPNGQGKIGDYYDMVSDNGGANLAWAATFNGEQDVYFLRIPADCDNNGVEDDDDLAGGAADCNGNLILDICEADCNNTGVPDSCELADGTSSDCNGNGLPDECDIDPSDPDGDGWVSNDCDGDGSPDECGTDCNSNNVLDICDLDPGDPDGNGATSPDCDGDGAPDECQFRRLIKLTASDAMGGNLFGQSVSASGNTLVVGASRTACAAGVDCGTAYIYRFDGKSWKEEATLVASDAAEGDLFAASVSVDGDTVVVGAWGDDCTAGTACGAAYVYRFDGKNWQEESKLVGSVEDDRYYFGSSVSTSRGTVVVGAFGADCASGDSCGEAFVYRFDGEAWNEEAKLTASDAHDHDLFGNSVSLSGETVVVGAKAENNWRGAAYVYRFNGLTWAEEMKLTASDAADAGSFGASVMLSEHNLIVGAFSYDCAAGVDCGEAYVYRFDGKSWVEEVKLTAFDELLGHAVSIHGDRVVVGVWSDCWAGGDYCGSTHVYGFDSLGAGSWRLEAKLKAPDEAPNHGFGGSVSLSGETVVIGASGAKCAAGEACGAVYVLTVSGDCNRNDELDECETISGTDFDNSGSIDHPDWRGFVGCMAGPGTPPGPLLLECVQACRDGFDSDGNGSIDLLDARSFQNLFGGP